MRALFDRLKQRAMVQWGCAYLAGAWLVLEVSDVVGEKFGWPAALFRTLIVLLVFGACLTLVLAWFHGEQGRQGVSRTELLMIAGLLALCGVTLRVLARDPTGSPSADRSMASVPTPPPIPLRAVLFDNPAVAILPLRNLGPPEDEAFAEGLHDDILSSLQQIGGMTVISGTSVRRYRDRDMLLPDIARELRVDAIGEGTVSRGGERIRVNVQLIDGSTDAHLWGGQYDREMTAANLFAIRAEIARSVARAMRATLTDDEENRLDVAPTTSLTAYDWVQIARSRCDGCDERGEAYRQAIAADSAYAPAWAGLSSNYAVRVLAFGAPPGLADSALAFADRALRLDPTLASAHGAKGLSYYAGWGQVSRALDHIRMAAALEPGSAGRWSALGVFLATRGDWVEALDAYWRSLRLRPTSAYVRGNMAELYAAMGLHERAQAVLAEASAISPDNETVLHYGSYARALAGDLTGARLLAERAVERYPQARNHQWAALVAGRQGDREAVRRHAEAARTLAPEGLSLESNVRSVPVTLAYALAINGDRAGAERFLEEATTLAEQRLQRGADDGYIRVELAAIAALRGRPEDAGSWLAAASEAGYRYSAEIELDPVFDGVRESGPFRRVMERIRDDVEQLRLRAREQEAELQRLRAARGT